MPQEWTVGLREFMTWNVWASDTWWESMGEQSVSAAEWTSYHQQS